MNSRNYHLNAIIYNKEVRKLFLVENDFAVDLKSFTFGLALFNQQRNTQMKFLKKYMHLALAYLFTTVIVGYYICASHFEKTSIFEGAQWCLLELCIHCLYQGLLGILFSCLPLRMFYRAVVALCIVLQHVMHVCYLVTDFDTVSDDRSLLYEKCMTVIKDFI